MNTVPVSIFRRLRVGLWLLLGILSLSLYAQVEPLNIMVGDFTFTRPPTWHWTPLPTNSHAKACFTIPSPTKTPPTDILFYLNNQSGADIEKAWKRSFPEADEPGNTLRETVKVNGREIVFITWRGVYQPAKGKPARGNKFVFAVLPGKASSVPVRLYGPEAEVDKALTEFKAMVESALKEL